ncbi:Hypothetical protein D9617_5g070630 [Elsinoe fawcettii]|nr:Hypothetical protein D9617_5g070630 [Elsinoe fawcettii]
MSSPSSPLLSVNVEELPRWVKQSARNVGTFSTARVRFITFAALCIITGYFVTSSLSGPPSSTFEYDYPQEDILEVPTDINSPYHDPFALSPPPHHALDPSSHRPKTPSIKGALSDLRHAVSGHLTSFTSPRPAQNKTYLGAFTSDTYNTSSPPKTTETILHPGSDLLGARPSVGKVTIIFGGAAIYERALKTHIVHDRMHGYPLHVLRHGMLDDVWSKPAYILNLLLRELAKPEQERLQWLLWVDADTILLNPYVPVETFLPPSPEFDDVNILVTRDWNGLNNGVFPVRVCQWSVELFAAIVSYRFYRPEAPLVFRDQSAMDELLKDARFKGNVVWAPQRWFNAYQGEHNETLAPFQVRRGDFLVHFAGVGDRESRMLYWLERTEQHLPDWEIEVRHTSYPGEAREFWREERGRRSENAKLLVEAKGKASGLWEKTEAELGEYQVRLQDSEREAIKEKVEKLKQIVGTQHVDVAKIEEGIEALNQARSALEAITSETNRQLLKEAHEAIFSAEKVLMSSTDKSATDIQKLEDRTTRLKHLVLQPSWPRVDMTQAIDEVRKVRAALESAQPPAPIDPEQAARLAAIEKQKYEAEMAKAEILGIDTHPNPPAGVDAAVEGVTGGEPDIVIKNVMVTHTQTAFEMTTHMIVVMETQTVDVGMKRR